jgi:p-cumate 2,3-dioxygenase subunit beta
MSVPASRPEVEDFLYQEASLLYEWRLPEWLALFTEDAHYLVPATDLPADASPDQNLFYIADDRHRLEQRVARLMKKSGHSEQPRSKTRHMVNNVRVAACGADALSVSSAFAVYRTKDGVTDLYVGKALHELVPAGGNLRIRKKLCALDLDGLRPQGRISIIL